MRYSIPMFNYHYSGVLLFLGYERPGIPLQLNFLIAAKITTYTGMYRFKNGQVVCLKVPRLCLFSSKEKNSVLTFPSYVLFLNGLQQETCRQISPFYKFVFLQATMPFCVVHWVGNEGRSSDNVLKVKGKRSQQPSWATGVRVENFPKHILYCLHAEEGK